MNRHSLRASCSSNESCAKDKYRTLTCIYLCPLRSDPIAKASIQGNDELQGYFQEIVWAECSGYSSSASHACSFLSHHGNPCVEEKQIESSIRQCKLRTPKEVCTEDEDFNRRKKPCIYFDWMWE
ncbi:hypothetical protein TNCT_346721 [Trichonephila clavata]|uniref:Uncharacterized protein n=1 Tax=Trichonephila clavata TaxID=2740835 RepID=A0A8X6HHE8_TRICU|nr:hypothetical protein TNCT_346721 [Trichonephila clavata]